MKQHVIVLIIMPCVFCLAQNLIQNPGFESWSGGVPDNWLFDADSVFLSQEDVIVYSGDFSVKDSFIAQGASNAELYQGFYAQPNTIYQISFWAYDNDSAGRARAGVQWFGNGQYLDYEYGDYYTEDSPNWQLWTWNLLPSPSNADSVRFIIRGYDVSSAWDGGAVFYVDDTYFGPPATQPPTILRFWHTPTNPGTGVTSEVYAYVIDNGTIDFDTLFYGVNNLQSPVTLSHISMVNDTFYYEIPAQTTGDTIFYYLKFVDNDGLVAVSDTDAYYVGELNVCINELYYDTPGADSGCFTEVFGPGMLSLDGFTLVGVNGNGGVDYVTIDLAGQTIPSDGFFVVGDNSAVPNVDLVDTLANIQNGPDNLELRLNGITIDAVGYGTLDGWVFTGEWLPAIDVDNGHSLGRYPDGDDTDNNEVDFHDYETPTPGEPNPPVGIDEHETAEAAITMPVIANPLRIGLAYGALTNDIRYYPLTIYNAMGQAITQVFEPENRLTLATGVYFVKFNNVAGGCAKIVVVK